MKPQIEIGKVSARGQIAIPLEMRKSIDLKDGEKILFLMDGDAIVIRKISESSLAELLKPLHQAKKNIKESEVNNLIHGMRKKL
jgi:AbrB family looped-hinge helix DNA binding protein